MISDETGKKELPISKILQESIRFFFVKALETLSKERNINREDVYWVFTVPAIWNESEKQIMEEAAKMVNIINIARFVVSKSILYYGLCVFRTRVITKIRNRKYAHKRYAFV